MLTETPALAGSGAIVRSVRRIVLMRVSLFMTVFPPEDLAAISAPDLGPSIALGAVRESARASGAQRRTRADARVGRPQALRDRRLPHRPRDSSQGRVGGSGVPDRLRPGQTA